MKYPRSLAVTYETSVAQLSAGAKEFFRELSWLAPDPLPRNALEGLPDPADARRHLSELDHLHLVRFQQDGKSFTVHRLVQEITRQKQTEPIPPPALVTALRWINDLFIGDPQDVRTWPVLDPLALHSQVVAAFADDSAITEPTARLMNQVGLMLETKAKYHTAEPLYRRSLEIDEAKFGSHHPEITTGLNNLAQLLKATNRHTEAEPLLRRALAIAVASFGVNHPKVANYLNNLANLLDATNRLAEAEPLMKRALEIDEAHFGSEHIHVARNLNNFAQLLQDTNRPFEAEPLTRRALCIFENSLGSDHPKVAVLLNNLGRLLVATNRRSEAEPLYRRALAISETRLGNDHPEMATVLHNLASLMKATNRLTEAEPLMRRAVEVRLKSTSDTGHHHPKLMNSINSYFELLTELGETQDQAGEKIGAMLLRYGVSI
jgi:tetratricopeptide (TPR) repeat protein